MSTKTQDIFNIKDRVVVITGGAGLLGIKHAEAVIEIGGVPILLDIHQKSLDGALEKLEGKAFGIVTDVTNKESVQSALDDILKKHARIDVLINNAANDPKVTGKGDSLSRFETFPEDEWNNDISVGLTGAFVCSQVFGNYMAQNKRGVIVNISSDLGIVAPDQKIYRKEGETFESQNTKPVTYSVVKHGIIGLTKYLASYWGEKGIRVNAIAPGGVYADQPNDFVERLTKRIPLGRMAHKDEYKGIIQLLISDASQYITGTTISIDGGRTIR
ncbi:oxidoreductase [bacterium]|nr:oxidoreductase [bacterium]|tara:strand:- start:15549 stop:16367 length:819 start_codon:yes stop_codon:yes gene_type:complete